MPLPTRRVALVLSGCGVHDGSEIHESVLCLLALDRAGARVVCAAPNAPQHHVVDHYSGEINCYETRNALVESARIARGAITDLAALRARDLDAAVFPGGYGATKTLSDYAFRVRSAQVHPEVARLVRELHAARKPMAFLCTAPLIAARVLGGARPRLTIGTDAAVAADLEAWGAQHEPCDVRGLVVDREHKLVSTPAYMLASRIGEAAEGIERAVRAMLELA
jgi:enhancing lycopene biosynthesis protein 2